MSKSNLARGAAIAAMGLTLSSCADYLNRYDTVTLAAGEILVGVATYERVRNAGEFGIRIAGTNAPGNHQGDTFKGTWYAFIAHTYDGGVTPVVYGERRTTGGDVNNCQDTLVQP